MAPLSHLAPWAAAAAALLGSAATLRNVAAFQPSAPLTGPPTHHRIISSASHRNPAGRRSSCPPSSYRPNPNPQQQSPPVPSSPLRSSTAGPDDIPGVNEINLQNTELLGLLDALRTKPYFRLYSVDILASCEYIPQELFECYSESCEIYPVDDEEVPPNLKDVDSTETHFALDGWARWDMPTDDYYDTIQFPEEFTGYDGADVWNFIHERICFDDDSDNLKADFNKAVSGLHSMISAQIVRGISTKIETGEGFDDDIIWTDPRIEFDRRLGPDGENGPKATENLYFTYGLLLAATSKVRDRLDRDINAGKIDAETASAVSPVLSHPLVANGDPAVYAASARLVDHAASPDANLWEVRMRVRDLMRIMNCVQCNKCRLHGKVSVLGLSAALRILLGGSAGGRGGDDVDGIHRVELAALLTVLGKFATAVDYCQKMSK